MVSGEVDALAGGGALVDALFADDRPLDERLRAGFLADESHPRASNFAKRRTWRRHLVEAPLPRWVAAAAIVAAPGAVSDRHAARWLACLLMALAACGAAWLVGGGAAGLAAGIATMGSAAALDAAGGAGAGAVAAVSMAALLVACQRVVSRRGGPLPVGVAWGALLACHPAALFLLVPVFATVAIAWRAEGPARSEAALPLPSIPPGLLLTPAIALALLVATWPTLWLETGRGVATWLTDTWWAVTPDQTIAGQTYHQPGGRPPAAFTAILQWLVWTPWPVLLAWLAGVVVTVRRGREGLWSPILMLATVLLVGAADGGLFGARHSLLAWLWVPTAATAGVGLAPLGRRAAMAVPAVCLAWSLVAAPWGAEAVGAEVRGPTPVAQLQAIADAQPGARVHVASSVPGQRYAVDTLRWRDTLDVRWTSADDAEWAIVLGDRPGEGTSWQDHEPEWTGRIAGVRSKRYRVR
jgi:hypothetical protein